MDPISIVGLTATSTTLLRVLGQSVMLVRTIIRGIRDADETSRGFMEELDTFYFALPILDSEVCNSSIVADVEDCWGVTRLDALFTNSSKAFSKLEYIFSDIHKARLFLRPSRISDSDKNI